jgi:hypothetical protein
MLQYRGFRQECYNETTLSVAHYSRGYLYYMEHFFADRKTARDQLLVA